MNPSPSMRSRAEQYLAFRRGLGYQLKVTGQLLLQFADFVDASGHKGPLTIELALRWARLPQDADPLYWARRLEVIRPFARYLAASEPETQIPPRRLLGPAHRRTTPFIFSDADLDALLAAARRLRPPGGLRSWTYATLFGLLASTGLRISEALRLDRADVDVQQGSLLIHQTKFNKSRLVPLHPSTLAALLDYARRRDRLVPAPASRRFFVCARGRGLPYSTVQRIFHALCASLDWHGQFRGPRLHDLRHSFACRRLQAWYDAGIDLAVAVPALSVYLGHANVSNTYWYLTATPALMNRAAERFERFAAPSEEAVP